MKCFAYAIFAFVFLVTACNQDQKKAPAEYLVSDPQLGNIVTDTSSFQFSEEKQCFTAHIKNDSAFLVLDARDENVTGKMWYKFAEKDNSRGTLKGKLVNDTLRLNYIFNAEGKQSEMPLKLYYKDGNLYEVDATGKEGGFVFVNSTCKDF